MVGGNKAFLTYTCSYSQFLEQVQRGQVTHVLIGQRNSGAVDAKFRLKAGETERTILPADYREALAAMQIKRVNIEIADPPEGEAWNLLRASPVLFLLGPWIILMVRKDTGAPWKRIVSENNAGA